METSRGFTLIEIMIAVLIIAILATVVLPSYNDSVKKSRRADAQAALLGLAQAMERFYSEQGTYAGAAGTALAPAAKGVPWIFPIKSPIDGGQTFYELKILAATANTYRLAAQPVNTQAGDGILVLTSSGRRGWDRDNSGRGTSADGVGESEWCWESAC